MTGEGFLRPKAVVLGDNSLIPPNNLIRPPPNCFTHEVVAREPFYFESADRGLAPDGWFEPGTKVVLLVHEGGDRCRVVDGNGLYVEVAHQSLRPA